MAAFVSPVPVPVPGINADKHGGGKLPDSAVSRPQLGSTFILDDAVKRVLPVAGSEVMSARNYGMSLWGQTGKVIVKLPTGQMCNYFLKTVTYGDNGAVMMNGEYESLKALHAVSPDFIPTPLAWGKFDRLSPNGLPTHFFLMEFREVGEQPPNPVKFTAWLAQLHQNSESPTGKFGFHVTTCHSRLQQITNCWEDEWWILYKKQLEQMIKLDTEKHGVWPEFRIVCDLVLDKVIPRLLKPLQSEGRSIKPCLVHGNLWDENTATDLSTGDPFIFDGGSFYAHNEYEIGNWRAPRHRLSDRVYVRNYQRNFPISEPEEEWDDRNLLYSLRFDLGTAVLIPGCSLRQVVKDGMTRLCEKFCPEELRAAQGKSKPQGSRLSDYSDAEDEEEEEEEEEE